MLTAIAEAKAIIERAKLLPKHELRLRRQALIRMTHSSTHIEGNILDLHQVEAILKNKKIDAPERDIFEVQNYLNALRYITHTMRTQRRVTEKIVLKIHQLVTHRTLPDAQSGVYRTVPVYVVRRRLGRPQEVLYTAAEAKRVRLLITDLLQWIHNSEKQHIHPIIVAGIVHLEIAAIHPFIDGNGRTARALATLLLYQRGYDFRRLFALEDYYNEDRPAYYAAVNVGKTYEQRTPDCTAWLEYFVRGFQEEIGRVKTHIASLALKNVRGDMKSQIYLDEGQMKILDFIDHVGRVAMSDVMNVLECPKRTAQLQLQKLKKLKMIVQVGRGPSSAYILFDPRKPKR